MTRTTGAKNIIAWDKRSSVPTTDSTQIKHLFTSATSNPLREFQNSMSHQRNYLSWIDTRHEELSKLKKTKDSTFKKYRWYAEQQTLFEAVNAFEVFFKNTFIVLGEALKAYIPAEQIKGSVDARIVWTLRGKTSAPALIFEHQLFHDLEQIDKASYMLIEARRYNTSNPSEAMRSTVKALQGIFQIRHTLAHNQGYVTTSDAAKFQLVGYSVKKLEVIDPQKDQTGESIRRFLQQEAKSYTAWLLEKTACYLGKYHQQTGIELQGASLNRIEGAFGKNASLSALPWKK